MTRLFAAALAIAAAGCSYDIGVGTAAGTETPEATAWASFGLDSPAPPVRYLDASQLDCDGGRGFTFVTPRGTYCAGATTRSSGEILIGVVPERAEVVRRLCHEMTHEWSFRTSGDVDQFHQGPQWAPEGQMAYCQVVTP